MGYITDSTTDVKTGMDRTVDALMTPQLVFGVAHDIPFHNLFQARHRSLCPRTNHWTLVLKPLCRLGQSPLAPTGRRSSPCPRDKAPEEHIADAILVEPRQERGMEIGWP